jgi:superfamily I DNA/RNA helicase/RecB family exonuclease
MSVGGGGIGQVSTTGKPDVAASATDAESARSRAATKTARTSIRPATRYRLAAPGRIAKPPELDPTQQSVVDHKGGPLLVLAGPGTGKTTTLIEAVVDRIDNRGLNPDHVLVLTFSRKAADQLRTRITARLGRTMMTPLASTFHSFAYALLRKYQPADLFAQPLRLLSAPEQDVRLGDLLKGSRETGLVSWPEALADALPTRGLAREIHAVLSRARDLGLDPADLTRVGPDADRPEWAAIGEFMHEYLTVLDLAGVVDYAELIHRAVLLAESSEVRAELRNQFQAVFVDEYQDTDPTQVRLLQAIAGDGRDVVVVGDPDQSIYAFRGADVRGIGDFPLVFTHRDGSPATVIALGTTRRFGANLLTASRRVVSRIGVPAAIPADQREVFRNPETAPDLPPGKAEVALFPTTGAEIEHIGDLLRRAHLEQGVPWSEMAVLVRSGQLSIPALRRGLVSVGVPVEVANDEIPLRQEPAVQPLLTALRVATNPNAMTTEQATTLLLSPLGGLDPARLRILGRALRRADRDFHAGERLPAPSIRLLRDALLDPASLEELDRPGASSAARLGRLVAHAHEAVQKGATTEEVIWALWSGTRWSRVLRAQAGAGGPVARTANRDLDAVCALFELAARAEEQQTHSSVRNFLEEVEAQTIPADTLADRGVRGEAVRLLTAHRSKGLEWQLVVVASVQEGRWPDLRRRGTLLQPERLGKQGLVEPTTTAAMLAEERRLFYVATTRARARLVITAVKSSEQDGDQPSRFVEELGVGTVFQSRRPARPMSLTGIVGELRKVAGDPAASPALRRSAAARLARLRAESAGDAPIAPSADHAAWWGLRERTRAALPVRPDDEPVRLTASALTTIGDCALRWFLSREAGGESGRSTALGFGSVLHVLADHWSKDSIADIEKLLGHLDSVWDQLAFDGDWKSERERLVAHESIRRFVAWHDAVRERTFVASEADFDTTLPIKTEIGGDEVRLHGRVDRLERNADGDLVVIDFKTGRSAVAVKDLPSHPQLGLYQAAVEAGGFDEITSSSGRSGGAELVQLRQDDKGLPKVQSQAPQVPDESGRRPVDVQIVSAVSLIRDEAFAASLNRYCAMCDFAAMCPAQQSGGGVL